MFSDYLGSLEPLNEGFKNLFSSQDKEKYAQEAHELLQNSYKAIGGIKGTGFKSTEDVLSIPFWKLRLKDGKITLCAFYKVRNGRKLVAFGADGSDYAKKHLAMILKEDLLQSRSYTELSSSALRFLIKNVGIQEVKRHIIPLEEVPNLLKTSVTKAPENSNYVVKYPELKDGFYSRNIGDEDVVKIMLGTPRKNIK